METLEQSAWKKSPAFKDLDKNTASQFVKASLGEPFINVELSDWEIWDACVETLGILKTLTELGPSTKELLGKKLLLSLSAAKWHERLMKHIDMMKTVGKLTVGLASKT